MFTGIIEGFGRIKSISGSGSGRRIAVESDFQFENTKIGDSIAVNGACLTAVRIYDKIFEADLSPETIEKSTFKYARHGDRVNLERALKVSDRFDGHIVSGHIDSTGVIQSVKEDSNSIIIKINAPESINKYIIEKGSVAVDGTSLTVNSCGSGFFSVAIIPHTKGLSIIGSKKSGEMVNLEADIIGKYIEKLVRGKNFNPEVNKGLSMDFLKSSGYL